MCIRDSFEEVLISGTTPYTIEEVDTAIRYVVPEDQTAPVKWNEVTTRNFTNILKKFTVTVTKSDAEMAVPTLSQSDRESENIYKIPCGSCRCFPAVLLFEMCIRDRATATASGAPRTPRTTRAPRRRN